MVNVFFKLVCFFIVGAFFNTNGQLEKSKKTYTIYINFEEYSVRANVLHDAGKVKTRMGHMYYWYMNNDIKKTDGSFDGKLLHGEYKSFFRNMNLKEQGNFKNGLKQGEWKTWYLDGKIQEIVNYNNGRVHGTQELYDEQGNMISKANFKNGVKNGKMTLYQKNKIDTVITYKNGEPQPSKNKNNFSRKERQNDSAKNKVKRVDKAKDTTAPTPKSSIRIKKIFNKMKKADAEPAEEKNKAETKKKATPKKKSKPAGNLAKKS
jgi:antitoxin component YwqK of YwqJK toxin-antitoxin module